MCGIIGIHSLNDKGGKRDVAKDILAGLQRLEYRGYDSAGMALLQQGASQQPQFQRLRAKGKLDNLIAEYKKNPITGSIGIGHTRWATHGIANEENAHPHMSAKVALVHNGIIENYQPLKDSLPKKYQQQFASQTDTEVLVYLLHDYLDQGYNAEAAVVKLLPRLKGAFAFVVIFADEPDVMIGACRGSPLAIGYGKAEMFLGSDALSLSHLTSSVSFLEEGDYAVLNQQSCQIYDKTGHKTTRPIYQSEASADLVSKGNYPHFMAKEIYEQPSVMGATLQPLINREELSITLPNLKCNYQQINMLEMTACGTAYYAGLIARYWCERLVKIPMHADVASEFRYRLPPFYAPTPTTMDASNDTMSHPMANGPNGKTTKAQAQSNGILGLVISQSGETMDSLEALRYFQEQNITTLALVNVPQSTIARSSDAVLMTHAGPEIGVASTKAFTTQLVTLLAFMLALAWAKQSISQQEYKLLVQELLKIPFVISQALTHADEAISIATELQHARSVLYLGRGCCYPLALEGALKLKEISYIHAEGYAAGEMKHGPIALVEDGMPIIVILPNDDLFEKNVSNLQEVLARGGVVYVLTDHWGRAELLKRQIKVKGFFTVPDHHAIMAPLVFAIPIQLIAYHTAALKGRDVDRPRNLAKSVTVE